MSTEMPSDSAAFQQFLNGNEIDVSSLSPEESVRLYRNLQHDVSRLKEKLGPSIRQARNGESKPLDIDAMLERIRLRIEESRGDREH